MQVVESESVLKIMDTLSRKIEQNHYVANRQMLDDAYNEMISLPSTDMDSIMSHVDKITEQCYDLINRTPA